MASPRRGIRGSATGRKIIGQRKTRVSAQPKTHIVMLECDHQLIFGSAPPKIGELLYCPRCRHAKPVTDVAKEWRFRCQDCSYARAFGAAKLTCVTKASAHSVRCGHRVQVIFGAHLIDTVGENRNQLDISALDIPPF
jgi:hypothetical protein